MQISPIIILCSDISFQKIQDQFSIEPAFNVIIIQQDRVGTFGLLLGNPTSGSANDGCALNTERLASYMGQCTTSQTYTYLRVHASGRLQ